MMRYTVTWHPQARDELARIWLDASDRERIRLAADRIDRELKDDLHEVGVPFYSERLLVDLPLVVTFTVDEDDRRVQILQVWRA